MDRNLLSFVRGVHQVDDSDVQDPGQPLQAIDRDVRDASLELRHIGSMALSKFPKFFLAEVPLFPEAANVDRDVCAGG